MAVGPLRRSGVADLSGSRVRAVAGRFAGRGARVRSTVAEPPARDGLRTLLGGLNELQPFSTIRATKKRVGNFKGLVY